MKGIKIKNLASRIKSIYETDNPLEILAMRGVKVLELELEDDMEYFEGAYIGNKDVNMVVYNKNLTSVVCRKEIKDFHSSLQ